MAAIGKQRDCEVVNKWIPSLVNHLYWTAASSANDSKDVIVAKWQSAAKHIQNINEGHGPHFDKCLHEPTISKKKWLKPRKRLLREQFS